MFDPNAAAEGDGIFGLPHTPAEAGVVLVPVPFEATTSYGGGAAEGPRVVLAASRQVDLFDVETGRPYETGIAMLPEIEQWRRWNDEAQALVRRIRDQRGLGVDDAQLEADQRRVDSICAWLNEALAARVEAQLALGKRVGSVGGDHGAAFGAIAAHAARHPKLGILHIDAHADLRRAYEGFEWSHASIMENVVRRLPQIERLVQVAVRDACEEERDRIDGSDGRIRTYWDADLARERFSGTTWAALVERIVGDLPREVYVSFDIDGLDPSLCPNTGTPVPGGLSFQEASYLLGAVTRSGRRIVGFDLVEVSPGLEAGDWDANVGARMLYKLIGWMTAST